MPRLKKPKKTKQLEPYWQTTDGNTVQLYHGDVIGVLDKLPPRSVQMCVTSPPYWGLRDYGTDKSLEIGSERTPEEFVEKMVQVFRSVRRVLRDDGLVFLNLGDTYHNGSNLAGVPWRVALALQADGWILRQDIIWAKPSPMPEPVRNRCTKAHEYVFMLSKGQDYFYDCEAVKDASVDKESLEGRRLRDPNGDKFVKAGVKSEYRDGFRKMGKTYPTRNKRSVWTIASESYAGAHFATFPTKLVEPCILAGTSAYGACAECGTPWERVVDRQGTIGGHQHGRKDGSPYSKELQEGLSDLGAGGRVVNNTVGWAQRCDCATEEVVPCVVLDPFVGSGTTCCVAIEHGRRSVGIDLSAKYLTENAIPRITGYLVDVPAKANLVAIKPDNSNGQAKRFRKGRRL